MNSRQKQFKKKTHTVDSMEKYDYSKFKDPDWTDDWSYSKRIKLEDEEEFPGYPDIEDARQNEYWGIHEVNGRLEIDVRRFEYVCYRFTEEERYFPKALGRKGPYYVPSKIHRHDYTYNYLMDCLDALRQDWSREYRPLIDKVLSPKDAKDNYRINTLMSIGDSESYEDVELGSVWAALKRISPYHRIRNELYCIFLTKVIIEIHRIVFSSMARNHYRSGRYSVSDLKSYCNGAGIDFYTLKNWKVYLKYNDIYNFLKHNSVSAYWTLKKNNPECVLQNMGKYKNAMYAANWLDMSNISIDELLSKIRPFLEDFCKKVLKENANRAKWDYDDYFLETERELEDPMEHFGIYAACGMSPFS